MAAEVFISYSSQDQERVVKIADKLRSADISIWVDESGISAATLWSQEIAEAITSCKVLVLMVTPKSVASENVVKEVSLAAEQRKKILPVILEPTEIPKSLQYHLAGIQHLDVTRMEASECAEEIIPALKQLLGMESEDANTVGHAVRASRRRSSNVWTAWQLYACAFMTAAVGWFLKPTPPVTDQFTEQSPPVTRLLLSVEENSRLSGGQLLEHESWAFQRPSRTALALSPDGRYLVYSATTDGTNSHLFLRPMDQDYARLMRGTDGATSPVFSPDGKSIGFIAGTYIKQMEIEGGEPRTIVGATSAFDLNWCDDGTFLWNTFAGPLWRVSAFGGTPEQLTVLNKKTGELGHRFPQLLPGSKAVLFAVQKGLDWDKSEVVVQSLENDKQTLLIKNGTDPRYLPTGHLLFVRKGSLMAVGFDPERLETLGQPVIVIEDVMQAIYAGFDEFDNGAAQVAFSRSGTLVFASGGVYPELKFSLVRVDRSGESQPLGLPPRGFLFPRLSPDGTQLAYNVSRGHTGDIWIYDFVRDVPRRLTTEGNKNSNPVWSSDGKWIAFSSDRDGSVVNLYRMAVDGTGKPERLTVSDRAQQLGSWSSEGVIAFLEGGDIWVLPPDGEVRPFFESPFMEGWPAFSPDGKWLAYVSDQSGQNEVYVRPYPGPDPPTKITSGGFSSPVWSRDGHQLYYRKGRSKILAVDVTPGQPFKAGTPEVLFEKEYTRTVPIRNYDVDPEGHFVMVTHAEEQPQPVTQIHVVLNWFTELNKLVPVDQN